MRLVTHGGKAHVDDFLSTCLLLALNDDSVIFRRKPTNEDLLDIDTTVYDVGGLYQPELNNFDHHQFPDSEEYRNNPVCALTLILRKYGLEMKAKRFWDWLKPIETFDCFGPAELAKLLEIKKDKVYQTFSPVSDVMVNSFSYVHELLPSTTLYKMMKMIGTSLISDLEALSDSFNYYSSSCLHKRIGDFHALIVQRNDPALKWIPEQTIYSYVDKSGIDIPVVVIPHDRKDVGYKLIRLNDDPRIDFRNVESKSELRDLWDFIHKTSGFVLSTTTDRLCDVVKLIESSIN